MPTDKVNPSVLGEVLDDLLNLGHIHLQVLVAFELVLHCHDILSVANLSVVYGLKVLLELIKFRSEFFPVCFDCVETLLSVCKGMDCEFALHLFKFSSILIAKCRQVLRSQPCLSSFLVFFKRCTC